MNVREFLNEEGIPLKQLAEEIGCSIVHLNCIARGTRKPGLQLAERLEARTGGKIRAIDAMRGRAADHPQQTKIRFRRSKKSESKIITL